MDYMLRSFHFQMKIKIKINKREDFHSAGISIQRYKTKHSLHDNIVYLQCIYIYIYISIIINTFKRPCDIMQYSNS